MGAQVTLVDATRGYHREHHVHDTLQRVVAQEGHAGFEMAGEFSTLEIGGFWDGHTPKTPPFVVPIRDRSYVQEFCVQHTLNLKMFGTEPQIKGNTMLKKLILTSSAVLFISAVIGVAYGHKDSISFALSKDGRAMLEAAIILRKYEKDHKSTGQLTDAAVKGMTDAIGSENYISYLPTAAENNRKLLMEEDAIGSIGIFTTGTRQDKIVVISDVLTGQPAERAGIRPGDAILRVNGNADVEDSLAEIHGPVGLPVKLEIWRSGCRKTLTIVRQNINFSSVEHRKIKGIPYIKIRTFNSRETSRKIREAVTSYRDEAALILDLRDNAGGFLDQAAESLGVFLGKKAIYTTVDNINGKKTFYSISSDARFKGKIFILINRTTVSAGEIFASAIIELGHAQSFGETTYGKGYTNALYPLSNGGLLAFARTKWLTPSGNFIEGKGIRPKNEMIDTHHPWPTKHAILTSKCTPITSSENSQQDLIVQAAITSARQLVPLP